MSDLIEALKVKLLKPDYDLPKEVNSERSRLLTVHEALTSLVEKAEMVCDNSPKQMLLLTHHQAALKEALTRLKAVL